jgi:hypothetical protein
MVELLTALRKRLGRVAGPKEDRFASVYERPDMLLVHAEAKTTAGVYVAEQPVIRLNPTVSPQEIGASVRRALAAFRTGVAHPNQYEWRDLGKPFLAAAGFRSWRALVVGAKMCNVTQKADSSFVFSITRNGGTRGDKKGFGPFGVPDQYLAAHASDAELGSAVLKALESCE